MGKKIIALQISGFGEEDNEIPVKDEKEQTKMIQWARNLGFTVEKIMKKVDEEKWILMVKMSSGIVLCKLGPRDMRKERQLKAFVKTANSKPGVTIAKGTVKLLQPKQPGQSYINPQQQAVPNHLCPQRTY